MNVKKIGKPVLVLLSHFACFFALTAFMVTCCMLLFMSEMSDAMQITYTSSHIRSAAKITFINVILLSVAFTAIDEIRRRITVARPVNKIVEAAERIAAGDFSVRIPPLGGISRSSGLDKIVDCYNKMAKELAGNESMQADFIANVSHEMKTPIAVMQNYATLLAQPELSGDMRQKYARSIGDASRRLTDLVTNILKLNKLENQQIYPDAHVYDLGEQLCECFIRFEHVWEDKNIEIDTSIEEDVRINADPALMSLVWNNLFSNAFKFTSRSGRVSLILTSESGYAVVKVKDTGCGISSEVGAHMFDKFYQGDTSRATQGNGLGLALVKRVIDIVSGEISVSSEVGVGSTFTVRVKLAE